MDHLNGRVQEALTAIRAIKAFVRGDYENEQFETVNDELAAASTNTFRYAVLNLPAFQAVMYTAIVCIMWYGGNFILTDRMTVGELTAFLSYVLQVLNSVMMFSGVFLQLTRSLTSARRIRAVLEEQPALATPADPIAAVADGSIDFADVSFKYSAAAARDALSHVTLHIPAGATVGIIGGTGAAKTTLVQLIPRLYDATSGTVKVGGQDVRRYYLAACGMLWALCCRRTCCSPAPSVTTCAGVIPTPMTKPCGPPAAPPALMNFWSGCRTAWIPTWARAA